MTRWNLPLEERFAQYVEPSITVGHYDLMLMEMKAELDAAEGR